LILNFKLAAVAELIAHAASCTQHSPIFADLADPTVKDGFKKPGDVDPKTVPARLLLVKDTGVYLMSSGTPGIPHKAGGEGQHVVYAEGLGPDADYDTIRDAVGGDDFVEGLPLPTVMEAVGLLPHLSHDEWFGIEINAFRIRMFCLEG